MPDALTQAVLQECLTAGVREFCVCAGSRNSPLVVELCRYLDNAQLNGAVRLYHFFEERCAAFFALGRVRQSGRPAAILTTSGTAAAELLPAMIEAHYQGLPLLAVTADRPRNYRGSGAPQAIEQVGLFGVYASPAADVASPAEIADALTLWTRKTPAHLNVCLDEPSLTQGEHVAYQVPADRLEQDFPSAESAKQLNAFLADLDGLLVLAGDLLPAEQSWARQLLAGLGPVALWAEASSCLQHALTGNVWLLRGGEASLKHWPVRKVLRLGGVPSCRFWRDLEAHPEIPVFSCTRSGHSGLARASLIAPMGVPTIPGPPAKLDSSLQEKDLRQSPRFLLERYPNSECAHLRILSRHIPAGSTLFLGNSLAIREWNLVTDSSTNAWDCHALRGANGIDGNISFCLGLSAQCSESWAVIGDLTALYDLAAPWILPQLPAAPRRFVIINNGGGNIFSRLPTMRGLSPEERKVIENHHVISFESWAKMWQMHYVRISSSEEWSLLALPDRAVVIEVRPDLMQSESFWSDWAAQERKVWG